MILAFELSMPNAASWNGKWSGEGQCYAVLKTFRGVKQEERAAELMSHRSFYYHWDDGWGARVSVREVDSNEARRLRKESNGFCGYDWMISSILSYGKIMADHEIQEHLEKERAAKEKAVVQ